MVSWGRTWKSETKRKTQFTADPFCPSDPYFFFDSLFFIVLCPTIPVVCPEKERNEAEREETGAQSQRKQQVGTGWREKCQV